MKVTIEIDCTPLEARQFFGLPDVQPMQAAVLAEMEKRMMSEVEKFSPEGFMRAWFTDAPRNVEWFRDMFGGFLAKANVAGAPVDVSNNRKKE